MTVPGTVDAWFQIAERFRRLGLLVCCNRRSNTPAMDFQSRPGWRVASPTRPRCWLDPYTASIYLPGGSPPKAGDRLVLADLARSLETVATKGRDVYYEGEIAERIVATSYALGGAFTGQDFSGHRGQWVEPIEIDYRGVTVAGMPPNSQGMTALLSLNLGKQVTLGEWGSTAHLHPLIEAKSAPSPSAMLALATPSSPRST